MRRSGRGEPCYYLGIMRSLSILVFILGTALPSFCQAPANTLPALPKDPQAIFAAAAPFYDFTSADLKPWHLKATYQLYDQDGKPTEQGTYEYWWVSPKVYRSTWTRPGATHTDWHTADGTHAYLATGEPIKFFERELEHALFSPLPTADALDPAKTRLELHVRSSRGAKFPCISLVSMKEGHSQNLPEGTFPTYCFDSGLPVLRANYVLSAVVTEFGSITKVQNRFVAREILSFVGDRELFSVKVDTIGGLAATDSALIPAPGATQASPESTPIGAKVSIGLLVKKLQPVYPEAAKAARQSGTVLLDATIGTDGKIHGLEVVFGPSKMLVDAAMAAVSQWQYKPYLLNGEPVEVETTISVIFSLGG
jgi:TonB family protein